MATCPHEFSDAQVSLLELEFNSGLCSISLKTFGDRIITLAKRTGLRKSSAPAPLSRELAEEVLQYRNQFKGFLSRIRVDSSKYGSQYFRRGGASLAFESGVPIELIQVMGDWKSYAVLLTSPATWIFHNRKELYGEPALPVPEYERSYWNELAEQQERPSLEDLSELQKKKLVDGILHRIDCKKPNLSLLECEGACHVSTSFFHLKMASNAKFCTFCGKCFEKPDAKPRLPPDSSIISTSTRPDSSRRSATDLPGQQPSLSLTAFRSRKEEDRGTFFRPSKVKNHEEKDVTIQIGIFKFNPEKLDLKPQWRKTFPLTVSRHSTYSNILDKAVAKRKAHDHHFNSSITVQAEEYQLLYPDGSDAIFLQGKVSTFFDLQSYKTDLGVPYVWWPITAIHVFLLMKKNCKIN
eukprot:gene13428-14808_t